MIGKFLIIKRSFKFDNRGNKPTQISIWKKRKTMAAEAHQDKEFLEFIVKSIVGNPDKVAADREVDERGVLLTLNIDPSDMGYVIGRRGQTAQAIRTLLKIVGAKNNARVNLKINEPEGSQRNVRTNTEEIDTSSVDDIKI